MSSVEKAKTIILHACSSDGWEPSDKQTKEVDHRTCYGADAI